MENICINFGKINRKEIEMEPIYKYIDDLKWEGGSPDNIIVEHRTNNTKRDFLFVNKAQCMHIPNSPKKIIDMSRLLAEKAAGIIPKDKKVIVIGFAETATAIGNLVADYLPGCNFVMTTTRENINYSKNVIGFKEEHSHASSQSLLTHRMVDIMNHFDYVLFVEDEISTGNTIINFIDALSGIFGRNGLSFGVASVCNWQNAENRKKFSDRGINVAALITGELKDPHMKMQGKFISRAVNENCFKKSGVVGTETYLFASERLGHAPWKGLPDNMKKGIDSVLETEKPTSVRVVGTEEFKYLPIRVGEYIESKGIKVLCQSTTRSPIDVSVNPSDDNGRIKEKYRISSVYEKERDTFIYNLEEKVDMTIVATDAVVTEEFGDECCRLFGKVMIMSQNAEWICYGMDFDK